LPLEPICNFYAVRLGETLNHVDHLVTLYKHDHNHLSRTVVRSTIRHNDRRGRGRHNVIQKRGPRYYSLKKTLLQHRLACVKRTFLRLKRWCEEASQTMCLRIYLDVYGLAELQGASLHGIRDIKRFHFRQGLKVLFPISR